MTWKEGGVCESCVSSIVAMNTFMVPHILRCSRHESGIFINDGFYAVNFGMVRILPTSIEIFDYEDDSNGMIPGPVVLCVQFANVTKVSANKFKSQHDNYYGGQIRLLGRFDRGVDEQLTFRMPFDR